MAKANYRIININLTTVSTDEPVADVPCGSCTQCCQVLVPYLTPDEISSGLYPLSIINPTTEQLAENPAVGPTVTLFKNKDGGCGMFVNEQCSIYDYRPHACKQFDCRKNHHPATEKRGAELNEQQ